MAAMGQIAEPTRRRMSAPARREQLLDVATKLAVEQSFHAVSAEAVARHAGVTRAVIYQHFRDLRALLEAIIDREATRALAQVSETELSDLSTGDSQELMLESLESYLRAVRDHPTTWRLVLMPPEGAPEILRHRIEGGRRVVLARLADAVRPALQADRANDAELTARVLSAISDEYARLVLTDPGRYPPERLMKHARWWLNQPSFGL
jgi:AcrR family transcriptional regulator